MVRHRLHKVRVVKFPGSCHLLHSWRTLPFRFDCTMPDAVPASEFQVPVFIFEKLSMCHEPPTSRAVGQDIDFLPIKWTDTGNQDGVTVFGNHGIRSNRYPISLSPS